MSGKVSDNLGRASGLSKVVSAAGGKILQVVTDTSSTEVATTSTTYTDSGLDVDITPSASSSLIYVLASMVTFQAGGYKSYLTLYRDSTNLGLASGVNAMCARSGQDATGETKYEASFSFLDSPSSTSALTYSVYGRAQTSGRELGMIKGSVNSIVAMEIDGS